MNDKKVFAKWVILQAIAELDGLKNMSEAQKHLNRLMRDDSALMQLVDAMNNYDIELIEVHDC